MKSHLSWILGDEAETLDVGSRRGLAVEDWRAVRSLAELAVVPDSRRVGAACRAVGMIVVARAARFWDDDHTRAWIAGPWTTLNRLVHRGITRFAPRGAARPGVVRDDRGHDRAYALGIIDDLAHGRMNRVVALAETGSLVSSRRPDGELQWLPAEAEGASLGERVAALFVADYLRNPADYAAPLDMCARCACPILGSTPHGGDHCTPRTESGVQLKT